MRIIPEHVEAGAGRRQQHRVAGLREFAARSHRRFQRRAIDQLDAGFRERRADRGASRPISTTART